MSTLSPLSDLAETCATSYPAIDNEAVGSYEKSWNNSLQSAPEFITLDQAPCKDPFSGQLSERLTKDESGRTKSVEGIEKMVTSISSSEHLQCQLDSTIGSPKKDKIRDEGTGVLITDRALGQLKTENDRLGRSAERVIDVTPPGGTKSKKQQQEQAQVKHRDDSGLVQTHKDGTVSWHKATNSENGARLGAVVKQKPRKASEKLGRRVKKKGEKFLTNTGLDNDDRVMTGTCSICGQGIEPGSKTMCKECMSRQKSLLTNQDNLDGQTLPSDAVEDNDLYWDKTAIISSGKPIKESHGLSNGGNVEHERSMSLEAYENSKRHKPESDVGEVYQRTLTDLQSQPKTWNSKVQPNFSEISYWEGNKEKVTVDRNAERGQVRSREAQKIICDESSSVESLNKDLKRLKSSHEIETSDEGSRSDLSHSEIYTDIKSEKNRRFGQTESQFRKDQETTPDTKDGGLGDEQSNDDGSNPLRKIGIKGRLQRAKTDSEIVRAVLEQEAKELQSGQNGSGNEDTSERMDKMPGKKLKRKTSSQSVDTGRGVPHKKDVKTKGEKLMIGVENNEMGKALHRGRGHGYKSRVGGSTVATFRSAGGRDKFLGESKRVLESPSSDFNVRMSNTSLITEKPGKKAFANLRSHTIIGGNMVRNRDVMLKKDKKRADGQQTPGSVESQVICETPFVTDSSAADPSGVNSAVNAPSLSLYEIVEESDESYDDSSVEEDIRKVGIDEKSSMQKIKAPHVDNETGMNYPCTDISMEAVRNRLGTFPKSQSSPLRETMGDISTAPFREYRSAENSDSNDENSRPFQGSHQPFSKGQDDQEEEQTDSEYLNASAPASPVMVSQDIYYEKGQLDVVKEKEQISTPVSKLPLQESPYHLSTFKYANPHLEFEGNNETAIESVEKIVSQYDDRKSTLYDETDVDTGITTASHRICTDVSQMRSSKEPHIDLWGQPIESASNSSNDSNQATDEHVGNWYTGGFFNEGARDAASSDNSESTYFNDGRPEAREHPSDHDIYTGQVFSVAMTNDVNESALGFEGNKNLNSNVIPFELIVPNNNQNNSVRQQMFQLCGRPQSQELPREVLAEHDTLTKDQRWKIGDLSPQDYHLILENFSNNSNGKGADYEGLSSHSYGQGSETRLISSVTGSPYTEYNYDIGEENNIPRLQSPETCYLNLSKYESSMRDLMTSKSQQTPNSKLAMKDILFFGDDCNGNHPTSSHSQEHALYFASTSRVHLEKARAGKSREITLCSDSNNSEDYYVMPKDECNNNNNADCGEGEKDAFDNWYTGSVKNEEEFKPVFEKEFNATPVVWPLHQTIPRDITPNYFYQGPSDVKPYVSEDDCDYACEQKMKQQEEHLSPKPALLFKVGGIVIRNNVQDDTDYAKNINMDLQEEPRPYVRYDKGEHNMDGKADEISYEKNVVYDDFTTSRPWEEDDRAPWRITKGQNCGFNMEKSLEGAYDIKKAEKKLSKDNGRSWGGLVNTNINAPGVVKYLGSYVTRWF